MFAVDGVIHTYRVGDRAHEDWTKVKHVPRSAAVAYFDGSWRGRIRWRRATPASSNSAAKGANGAGSDNDATLLDLSTLLVIPKRVRPRDKQGTYESRKLWESVTAKLLTREFGEATKSKHVIEQKQREKAADRKRKGEE